MKYKKQAHAVYYCDYHLVLTVKYRRAVINPGIFAFMVLKFKEIRKHYPEIEFKEVNYDVDHVHLLISLPPKMAVSTAVRIIKSNSARAMREKFPHIKKLYWGGSFWSSGYFVSTIGLHESTIRKYIKQQGQEDSGQATLVL